MAVTIKINPCPQRYNSANPYKTGQTTSYATGDDGDLERGRGSDFTTLDFNNPFGNTNRFTDTLGGQTYADDIVIDWSTTNYINETVIGWYGVVLGVGVSWATAMSGQPYTVGSYNDWYIPNFNEAATIINWGGNSLSHIGISNTGKTYWTSTTLPTAITLAQFFGDIPFFGNGVKTATRNFIVLRYFTFTELGV